MKYKKIFMKEHFDCREICLNFVLENQWEQVILFGTCIVFFVSETNFLLEPDSNARYIALKTNILLSKKLCYNQ